MTPAARLVALLLLAAACTAPAGKTDARVADSGGAGDTGADTASDTGTTDIDTLPEGLNGEVPAEPVALPAFAARNQYGEARSEADLVGHPTVLWFYPAAGTYG